MPHPLIDMTGIRIGKYTVVRPGEYINGKRQWILQCNDCGAEISKPGTEVRKSFLGIKCAGCYTKERQCTLGFKKCIGPCKMELPLDSFFACKHHYDGKATWCKECLKGYKKVIHEMITGAKKRAKMKGLEFDLTLDFIRELNDKQNGRCAYTNTPLNWDRQDKSGIATTSNCPDSRASLDRINSSKGYTQDNVQLVTYIVNLIKNAFPEQDFLNTCQAIVNKAIESGKLQPHSSFSIGL